MKLVGQKSSRVQQGTAQTQRDGTRIRLGYKITDTYLPIKRQTNNETEGPPGPEFQPTRQTTKEARDQTRGLESLPKKQARVNLLQNFLFSEQV